ncbi:LOW QUALITY PROTEIN: Pkinase domain-containing protein [Cephalotus follicularis]|uniref:cyclin-dependent kinase n=1 Tax=Cephalotus follicularis TaxID=3775 RepID=A0A1Q3D8U7_CEPFO|nr:LOW QUALITY PROTEIN: Pkinase domain-containing protein [Cephalotus follicularis]
MYSQIVTVIFKIKLIFSFLWQRFLYQILQRVSFYHSNKILHGDLTPHHVLINETDYTLKIADFGMAIEFIIFLTFLSSATLSYKAPELLLGSTEYSFPADMWSVGCIFAKMVIKKPLFPGPLEFHEKPSIFRCCVMDKLLTHPHPILSFCAHSIAFFVFKFSLHQSCICLFQKKKNIAYEGSWGSQMKKPGLELPHCVILFVVIV